MKPGYKTSEFYLTVITQAIGLATALGLITADEALGLTDATAKALVALGALFTTVAPVWKYIEARGRVKAAAQLDQK